MGFALVTFLGVTLGILGLCHLLAGVLFQDRARVRKRIAEECRRNRPLGAPLTLYKDLDVLNLTSTEEYTLLAGDRFPARRPPLGNVRKHLEQWLQEANVSWRAGPFLLLVAAAALAVGLAGAWFWWWPGGLAGLAGAALPLVVVHYKRKLRRQRYLNQLPNAFALMARVIRAGHTVAQAVQAVAEAFTDPLAGEFSRCRQRQDLGLAPEVVFQEMARRSGILEMRIFVMAMGIQRLTGGNLSEVLERLAGLLRERQRLRQQVRTLTAEGRLQGLALTVLPFVLFAALYFLNRQYAQVLLEHSSWVWLAGGLLIAGIVWIRKIVNFEG
jgi:tight adherence protein B